MDNFGARSVIVGTIAILIIFVAYSLWKVFAYPEGNFVSLAILILVGLAAFMGLMNFLSLSAQWIGIADPKQPFGLPEGTVRAILTIAFIVLVGVLASFLLTHSGARQQYAEKAIILQTDLALADAQTLAARLGADGLVALVPTKPGEPARVDVHFFARNDFRLSDDVAKQILTILSTILAAMIGFYFGARPGDAILSKDDQAERSRLRADLDTLLGQEPTVQSTGDAVEQKLAAVEQEKKPEVEKIKADLAEIRKKIDAARTSIGDLSLSIDKVRAAQAEAGTAVANLAKLKQQLEKI
jgi:hypothetical protein